MGGGGDGGGCVLTRLGKNLANSELGASPSYCYIVILAIVFITYFQLKTNIKTVIINKGTWLLLELCWFWSAVVEIYHKKN